MLRAMMTCLLLVSSCGPASERWSASVDTNPPDSPASGGTPPATDENFPGAEGKPSVPFGAFSYARFVDGRLGPSQTIDFNLYSAAPSSGRWSPDYAAMQMLAKYHGVNIEWCWLDGLALANGVNCCSPTAPFDRTLGFADTGPIVACGQIPTSWNVGRVLAAVGLRGLHVARPLTAKELRTELVNGRPVLVRSAGGTLGAGALLLIAGWSPIDDGGDRFLLVREGLSFQWEPYVDIIEARSAWLGAWTDSWYRVSTRLDGCVTSFDPTCAN